VPERFILKTRLTLLQVEFLHTGLIGSDCGALDADSAILNGLGGINGDLVVGLISVFQALLLLAKSMEGTLERIPSHST
jgi:hypothetical protein